jgi:hypothetical protein
LGGSRRPRHAKAPATQDLYSRRCASSGRLLDGDPATGALLPPTLRPFRVPWRRLQRAAWRPEERVALHEWAALRGSTGQHGDAMQDG